jgi:hypothetical protein
MLSRFDLLTMILTLAVTPLAFYVIRRIITFARENASNLLDALFYFLGRMFKQSLMSRASLRRYCRACLEKDGGSRYLPVPGRETVQLETDFMFVPLVLQTGTGERTEEIVNKLMSNGARVRVIGDPGSGKSSLVKKEFRRIARWASRAGKFRVPKLPVLLELRSFQPPKRMTTPQTLGKWALEQARSAVALFEGFDMSGLFDTFTTGRGIVLFLDGLDEVSGDTYERVAISINELSRILANRSENNAIVLTMRTQFHQQVKDTFEAEYPQTYHLQPFTPGDIYRFLSRWPFVTDETSNATRIFNELTDRPTLREMCSNPLVLAMYVANDQQGAFEGGLPDTRTAFYGDVVEELLARRRSRQLGNQARSRIGEQRESLLGQLAAENLLDRAQPANSVSWSRAIELMQQRRMASDAGDANDRLKELAKETGLFAEERPNETFRFIHLTFCEYLAAREFSHGIRDGWKVLINQHQEFADSGSPQLRSRLVEVLPFCVASVPRSSRTDALDATLKVGDGNILGRCFLETQAYDHSGWPEYRSNEAKLLIDTPPEQWDEVWIKRLHLFSVVLADEQEWAKGAGIAHDSFHPSAFFGDLVKHDTARLARIFGSFAQVDAPAAFRLADAIGLDLVKEQPQLIIESFDDPAFRGVILQRFEELSAQGFTEGQLERWCVILAAAGMREELVADDLIARDPTPPMQQAVSRLSRSQKWFRPGRFPSESDKGKWSRARIVAPSLYTYAISIALQSKIALRSAVPGFESLQRLKSPQKWWPAWLISVLYVASWAVLLIGGGIVAARLFGISTPVAVTWFALCGIVPFIAGLFLCRYLIGRPFLYGAIVNIIAPRGGTFSRRLPWLVLGSGGNYGSIPWFSRRLISVGRALRRYGFS